ncbi:MAG: histidine phosphatase family protein [Nocardioides sp.]
MSSSHRTIVVMRHAKAEQDGPSDFERELAPRGVADAAAAGDWLAGAGVRPDCALVSGASRARQTWAALAERAGWDLEPTLDRGLYAADPDTALDVLRGLDEACGSAIVVGHNPTMASLAQLLEDGDGDEDAANEMAIGTFPTSATAVLTFSGAWVDLGPGMARLAAYHVGRG